ncbi:MAG: putative signal transduction protein with EFhand domain protein [Polaromonas sp.]|nr:putative signal transduction protein with EFhand domain protein [Polaromonas sp.]
MKTSLTTLLSGTAIALASLCTFSAFAQTPPPPPAAAPAPPRGEGPGKPPRASLRALDVNKDKMLSKDEVKGRPMLEKNFDAIDTNKDGQLTRAEMKAYREAHKGERKK